MFMHLKSHLKKWITDVERIKKYVIKHSITSNNTRLVNVMGLQTTLAFYITNDTQKKVKRKKIERKDTHTIKKGVY